MEQFELIHINESNEPAVNLERFYRLTSCEMLLQSLFGLFKVCLKLVYARVSFVEERCVSALV